MRRLRIALPVLAIVLLAAFVFNTQSNEVDNAFLEDFESVTAATEDLRMANPRFAGIDNEGRPFEITAESARQDPADKSVVDLVSPKAVQGAADDRNIVTANRGVFRSEENILELRDGVTLEHQIGQGVYVFRAPDATVAVKEEIVTTDSGVGGQGPDGGSIKADRMRAYNSEGRLVFEGNVSMRIYPKKNDAPDQPEKQQERDEGETQ